MGFRESIFVVYVGFFALAALFLKLKFDEKGKLHHIILIISGSLMIIFGITEFILELTDIF